MSLSKTYIKSKKAYKVSFKLDAQIYTGSEEIRLLGDFNDWNWEIAPSLKKLKSGYKIDMLLEPGKTYQYRYCTANQKWFNDEKADGYVPSPFQHIDNCVAEVPDVALKIKKEKIDLTLIEGIGPKIASILINAGYDNYLKLAKADPEQIQDVLKKAGKRYAMHNPTTWPVQSQLLADGNVDKLKALQQELKGGKLTK